ncbi:hypothetical protein FI667_g2484, partial [Globisporangium splendens]
MGQAGSVEQKTAIRDVVNLKVGQGAYACEKDPVLQALATFCRVFPVDQAVVNDDNAGLDVKDRRLFDVVHALLQEQTECTEKNSNEDLRFVMLPADRAALGQFHASDHVARALSPVRKVLDEAIPQLPGTENLMRRLSPKLQLSVLDTLMAMVTTCPGVEINEKTDKWETANRRNFGDGGGYEVLRSLMVQYSADADLSSEKEAILYNTLQLFHLTLATRRSTTDLLTCSQAVGSLLNARISLLDLCHHSNRDIQDYAIDLVKELFVLINLEQVHELQESAREYGALLYALATAVSETKKAGGSESDGEDGKDDGQLTPTNSARAQQDKCIDLVEMFCAGNTRSKKAMYRIFPVELFIPAENRSDLISRHTASTVFKTTRTNRSLPHFSFDFDMKSSSEKQRSRVATMAASTRNLGTRAFERWLNDARSQGEHWRNIIESVLTTHERPELVWRDDMRAELRTALQSEIEALEKKRRHPEALSGSIARWDHEMFYVNFKSIHKELIVNGYFIEYLIPKIADLTDSYEVVEPIVLAWHLSDQLGVEENLQRRLLCVRCLRLIIRRYAMIFHGQLPTRQVLAMLENHSNYSLGFIRECFLLLNTAIAMTRNAPSESLNRLSSLVASAVVNVLSDPVLINNLSATQSHNLDTEDEDSDDEGFLDSDEEQGYVNNENDGLLRAGLNVLLAIIRRSKYTLLLVRPKRAFICRLLAVETLDHITISLILTLLKQLSMLDHSGYAGSPMMSPPSSGKLSTTVDANWKSMALVYILFASCDPKGMGMCLQAAEFLKENYAPVTMRSHRSASTVSNGSNGKDKSPKSELQDILDDALGFGGCGMGPLLASTSAETFVEVFNAHQKRAADVMWGRRQRLRLFRYLKNKYVASTGDQTENQQEELSIRSAAVESTDVDEEDIFVGNIFIRSYIEGDGQFLTEWTLEMYTALMNALFHRLVELGRAKSVFGANGPASPGKRPRIEPWEIQVMILKALVKLIPSNCIDVEIQKQHYESLLAPLRRTLLAESDQVRGILAMELFIAILSAPQDRSVNTASCRLFLEEKGLGVLGDSLERMLNPTYQQLLKANTSNGGTHTARTLLYRITDVLATLSSQAPGIQSIKKNPKVVTSLLELSSKKTIMNYSEDAAAVCLDCLTKLCFYDELRALVVEGGGLLNLIETSAFCPVEEIVETPASTEDGNGNNSNDSPVILQRKPSRFFGAVRCAALTLRACLNDKSFSESSSTYQVLKQLLTPSFVRILRSSPDKFIFQLQTTEDINSSTLIWTSSMRTRLQDCIALELSKVKTAAKSDIWPRWDPDHFVAADSFRYQYPELADELIIHDVYLNNFVVAKTVDLDDITQSRSGSSARFQSVAAIESENLIWIALIGQWHTSERCIGAWSFEQFRPHELTGHGGSDSLSRCVRDHTFSPLCPPVSCLYAHLLTNTTCPPSPHRGTKSPATQSLCTLDATFDQRVSSKHIDRLTVCVMTQRLKQQKAKLTRNGGVRVCVSINLYTQHLLLIVRICAALERRPWLEDHERAATLHLLKHQDWRFCCAEHLAADCNDADPNY